MHKDVGVTSDTMFVQSYARVGRPVMLFRDGQTRRFFRTLIKVGDIYML
jgi:hypothetical protein